jgi:hypothetical protein
MATEKKRITISLSEEVALNFEQLAKDFGLTKSGLITVWVKNEKEKLKK